MSARPQYTLHFWVMGNSRYCTCQPAYITAPSQSGSTKRVASTQPRWPKPTTGLSLAAHRTSTGSWWHCRSRQPTGLSRRKPHTRMTSIKLFLCQNLEFRANLQIKCSWRWSWSNLSIGWSQGFPRERTRLSRSARHWIGTQSSGNVVCPFLSLSHTYSKTLG